MVEKNVGFTGKPDVCLDILSGQKAVCPDKKEFVWTNALPPPALSGQIVQTTPHGLSGQIYETNYRADFLAMLSSATDDDAAAAPPPPLKQHRNHGKKCARPGCENKLISGRIRCNGQTCAVHACRMWGEANGLVNKRKPELHDDAENAHPQQARADGAPSAQPAKTAKHAVPAPQAQQQDAILERVLRTIVMPLFKERDERSVATLETRTGLTHDELVAPLAALNILSNRCIGHDTFVLVQCV